MRVSAVASLVLTVALLSPTVRPEVTGSPVAVTDLRCEYRSNPLGIDDRHPCLSWILTSNQRNQAQSAYQVLVATSEATLARDRGDLWNSGKVVSDQSVHVVYEGRPLTSRGVCHWKVLVWDREGRVSPWRAPARYEAFLNGARVGDRVLDPGWTMYGRRVFYSMYDVTRQVGQGRNCLGVMLGNGRYNPLPLRMWGNLNLRDHLAIGRPRCIAQLEVELADTSRRSVVSDRTWRVADGPLVFNSVYPGEVYDARLEPEGWKLAGFDDRAWRHAAPAREQTGSLRAQPQPPIRITATFNPVAVSEPTPGVFIFDLEQNFAGWASLALRAPEGTRVTLRYGELLNANGTLNPLTSVAGQIKGRRKTKEGGSEKIGGAGSPDVAWQADTYVASGRGPEYTPRFTFHGSRYVEVTGYPGKPPLEAAARYSALAENIRRAFSDRVRKPAADRGMAPTQSAQAFALQAGLLDPTDRAAGVKWLLDDIRGPQKGHLATGIFGTKFALDVLSAEGHAQAVFDSVNEATHPGWGYMVASGATTLWEHWALSDNTYSHNHPMFGSISEWFFKWLGGIQPDPEAVGFDRIVVRPELVDGLAWVRSSYRSVRGEIISNWSRTGEAVEWQITIPANATATIVLPADSLDRIEEGRTTLVPARQAEGVRDARMDRKSAVFTVGSGAYRFVRRLRGK